MKKSGVLVILAIVIGILVYMFAFQGEATTEDLADPTPTTQGDEGDGGDGDGEGDAEGEAEGEAEGDAE